MRIVPLSQVERNDSKYKALKQRVLVLGSTGSIGRSTLDIIRKHPERFDVWGIVAGSDHGALLEQIEEFSPKYAALADHTKLADLNLQPGRIKECEILGGAASIAELSSHPDVDVVVSGIVGMAALPSVMSAIKAGKLIALANKECLVAGGKWVCAALEANPQACIVPVDSEHSALFQVLQGERFSQVERLILTASGGPFLNTPLSEFGSITPKQAIAHPRWSMGPKVSVDSATMMNKALEVIEAKWLFDIPTNRIDVLVHPQSIVHSLVRYVDGTELAQLSVPDMKGAIAYAMNYPWGRLERVMEPLDLAGVGALEFLSVDDEKFPSIRLAKEATREGGVKPFLLNLSNEVAVEAFLRDEIKFDEITRFVNSTLEKHSPKEPGSYEELIEMEFYFREILAEEFHSSN